MGPNGGKGGFIQFHDSNFIFQPLLLFLLLAPHPTHLIQSHLQLFSILPCIYTEAFKPGTARYSAENTHHVLHFQQKKTDCISDAIIL